MAKEKKSAGGRPRLKRSDVKSHVLHVRVKQSDLVIIKKLAKERGLTMTDLVVNSILDSIE